MQERLTKGMHPRSGRGSGQELKEIGLREWGTQLGAEVCCLLGDTLKLPAKLGNFVQRTSSRGCGGRLARGGGGVYLHVGGLGKAVGNGVVDPACHQLPGP